jgi:hypothetical protein
MTLQTVAVNAIVRATDLNQIINAITGVSNEPIHLDAVSNASVYALTVRNQGSGGKALMVQNAGGTAIIQADGTGVFVSHDGSTAATQVVNISATQTLTNKTLTAPTMTAPVVTGGASIAGNVVVTSGIVKTAKGVDVASANGTITLGDGGNTFNITGTNSITGITIKTSGTLVVLVFASTAKLIKGGNLKLHSTFNGAADETISLVSDGTNWQEIGRSTNPKVQAGTYVGTGSGTPTHTLDFTPSLVIISSDANLDVFFLTEATTMGAIRLEDTEPGDRDPDTKIVANGFQVGPNSAGANGSGTTYNYYAIGK